MKTLADHIMQVNVYEELLRKALNRLHNQGGDISPITHECNMLVAEEIKDALQKWENA